VPRDFAGGLLLNVLRAQTPHKDRKFAAMEALEKKRIQDGRSFDLPHHSKSSLSAEGVAKTQAGSALSRRAG